MTDSSTIQIEVEPETQNLLDEVDASIEELKQYQPFSPEVIHRISVEFLPDRITASLNIEGISITRRQTLLVMDAMTLTENSIKAEHEIRNALNADEFVYDMAVDGHPLSEGLIREVNRLLQATIIEHPGEYRTQDVEITGAQFQPPSPQEIGPAIHSMVVKYNLTKSLHPILKAVWLHATFTHIHPFADGNGRTGRLLQDFSLLSDRLYPTGIPSAKRDDYYAALEKADEGLWDDLAQLVARLQLDVISKIQSIVQEAESRGSFVNVLARRADTARSGALHKQFVVWRQRMQLFIKQMVETCDQLNSQSEIIHVKNEEYPIIDFDKWRKISERGISSNSWALKQTWYSEGEAFFRSILYFKRHNFRSDDTYNKDDLYGLVALKLTGGKPEYGARFDFDFFADPHVRFRQLLFVNDKLNVFSSDGASPAARRSDEENWECNDVQSASQIVNSIIEDVFVRKLGI
ncbi:MAG: Fic family protein [Croceibacterium sp.]